MRMVESSVTTSLPPCASGGSRNSFGVWICLLRAHVPSFQQFLCVLQALCSSLLMPLPPQFSLTSSGRSVASGQAAACRWFSATAVPRLTRYLFKGIRGGALSRDLCPLSWQKGSIPGITPVLDNGIANNPRLRGWGGIGGFTPAVHIIIYLCFFSQAPLDSLHDCLRLFIHVLVADHRHDSISILPDVNVIHFIFSQTLLVPVQNVNRFLFPQNHS